jgi:hypothetical protein
MSLRYDFDEHLRGELWEAVEFHNGQSANLIDVARVGDPPDLPLAS